MASTRASGEYTALTNERLPVPTSTSRSSTAVLAAGRIKAPKSGKSRAQETHAARQELGRARR
eukprot:2193977-Lingulodinium_polyedra.AAC.1